MKYTPIKYCVVIRPDKIEEKTKGGIYLPDKAKDREQAAQICGTLLAVGGNAFEEYRGAIPKVGDKVYYAKYAGYEVPDPDNPEEKLQVCKDEDLTLIIVE